MNSCVVCGRELPEDRPMVHVHCEASIGQHLDEIAKLWPLLNRAQPALESPGPWSAFQIDPRTKEPFAVLGREPVAECVPAGPTKGRSGTPARGTRTPPVPVDLDHLDLTAGINPKSLRVPPDPGVQVGYLSVATELDFWVKDWSEHLGQDLPGTDVPTLAGWLRERLGWACGYHHAVDEFAAKVEQIAGVLRHRAGESDDRMKIGRCPAVHDDRECGAQLRADAWLDVIECPRCTTRWHRSQWLILAGITNKERE